jgi:hypothetical protein
LAAALAALIPSIAMASPGEEAAAAEEAQDVVAKPGAEKVEKTDKADKADKAAAKHARKKGHHGKSPAPATANAHAAKSSPVAVANKPAKKSKKTASRTTSKKKNDKKASEPKAPPSGSRQRAATHAEEPDRGGVVRCYGVAVTIDRAGREPETLPLVDCAGRPLERTRERLSILARPWTQARPDTSLGGGGARHAVTFLLHPGLSTRLESIARHFVGKPISIVSGYRPQSGGSLHQHARALDVRVVGVANEELIAFCKTLPETGCGYYPNSSFVHIDVRDPGTGSASWIDASGPGDPPRYVTQWPEASGGMHATPFGPTPAEPHDIE